MKLHPVLHLYDAFLESDGSENCAKVLEQHFNRMFGITSLNDRHDHNVVSIVSNIIKNANDNSTSHDKFMKKGLL